MIVRALTAKGHLLIVLIEVLNLIVNFKFITTDLRWALPLPLPQHSDPISLLGAMAFLFSQTTI